MSRAAGRWRFSCAPARRRRASRSGATCPARPRPFNPQPRYRKPPTPEPQRRRTETPVRSKLADKRPVPRISRARRRGDGRCAHQPAGPPLPYRQHPRELLPHAGSPEPAAGWLGSAPEVGRIVIAGADGNGLGARRPPWITGLAPPDSSPVTGIIWELYTKVTSGAAGGCSRCRGGSVRPFQPDKGSLNMIGKVINHSPYPSVSWDKITDVRFDSPLCLCRLTLRPSNNSNSEAILFAPFEVSYSLDNRPMQSFKIDRNFITDGSSIPGGILCAIARLFGITRWGKGLEASIVHDYLYIAWQYLNAGATPKDEYKRFADEFFRQLLLKCGVGQLGASIRYHASRTCWGWNAFNGGNPNTWYTGKLPCCDAAKSAEKQSEAASLK